MGSCVAGLASGVGTGVAKGAPQEASSKIITRLATNEAFISTSPSPKCSQAHSDSVSVGTLQFLRNRVPLHLETTPMDIERIEFQLWR